MIVRKWIPLRRMNTLLITAFVSSLIWVPVFGEPANTEAQGVFGCPLPRQSDCELLIDGIDNAQALKSAYVDALQVMVTLEIDGDPIAFEVSASGPTTFVESGEINAADWNADIKLDSFSLPLAFRLVGGKIFLDVEPNNADNSWLAYDPDQFEMGGPDLTSFFNTFTFESLVSILNEVGDGVDWTTGRDVGVNGQDAAVFNADCSTASLIRTSFAYDQLVALALAAVEQVGFDSIDSNLLEFGMDFLITTLSDQLGGADFRITWVIGRDDRQIYELTMSGDATIDPLFVSFLVGDTVLLPNEIAWDVALNVKLSRHNTVAAIVPPQDVSMLDPKLIEPLLDLLFNQLFGSFLPDM